jgi:hypothetical protein
MTQQTIPTKADLIDALRSSGERAVARLRSLPAGALEEGRYESGWNGRQILAHIASIEWTYPRLIAMARGDLPWPEPAGTDPRSTEEPYRPSMAGGINDYNGRQVEKRAGASVAELIAEFETNRAATIAAVEGVEESLLAKRVRSAGGIEGPLAAVVQGIAIVHVEGHVADIVGGTGN